MMIITKIAVVKVLCEPRKEVAESVWKKASWKRRNRRRRGITLYCTPFYGSNFMGLQISNFLSVSADNISPMPESQL